MPVHLRPGPPIIDHDWMGTAHLDMDEPADTFHRRAGRSHTLAGQAVVFGSLTDGTLVHGTVSAGGRRVEFAWVTYRDEGTGRLLWEPITGNIYSAEAWCAFAEAKEDESYGVDIARLNVAAWGHWGPWARTGV
jgi:hypothetical protein